MDGLLQGGLDGRILEKRIRIDGWKYQETDGRTIVGYLVRIDGWRLRRTDE